MQGRQEKITSKLERTSAQITQIHKNASQASLESGKTDAASLMIMQ